MSRLQSGGEPGTHTTLGTVLRLWRYPVKSMLGEERDALAVDHRGAEGDRLYAVRDAEGRIGSGKSTRRFRQIDGLFGCRATLQGAAPEIRLPDGASIGADDPNVHAALSSALGRPVTLTRETHVIPFDVAPLHLLTTASLAWLQSRLPQTAIDERRFRPNLLLDVPGTEPVEQRWIGTTLHVGTAVLRIVAPTERCRMVTLAQAELADDARVLREIAQHAGLQFGVYAEVLVPATIRRGDPVRLHA